MSELLVLTAFKEDPSKLPRLDHLKITYMENDQTISATALAAARQALLQKATTCSKRNTRRRRVTPEQLRGNSSAYDAPAAAVAEMVEAIAYDRKSVLPTVTFLEGEYGQNDITIGVPAVLGKNGMERVIELELNEAELGFFNTSVAAIRKELETLSEITSQA